MIAELVVAAALGFTPSDISQGQPTTKSPAGDIIILSNNGGLFRSHAAKFDQWQSEGRTLIITSWCLSACTMALSNPKACAMPEAWFGFHQAREYNGTTRELGGPAEEVNRLLWERYPPKVRTTIKELTPELKYVIGTDLLPPCR